MGPKPSAAGRSSGPPASAKRRAAGPEPAARQKRAKMQAARSIASQPAQAALSNGELDLQAFVAAHQFEIQSLEQSMAVSKAVSTSRAFQKVPRGLRRRTASHNPKRVPRRLRARAKREMADDKTPTVEARRRRPRTTRARIRAETAKRLGFLAARARQGRLKKLAQAAQTENDAAKEKVVAKGQPRPKIRRNMLNDPPLGPFKFRKRQINKTWLPTHLWHAKRARMTEPKEPLWRFAIPLTPCEKIYRPTHRAQGQRGAVVWDTSYMSTIGLYGNPIGLERVLRRLGVASDACWNSSGSKWRAGSRSWSGLLSRDRGDQRCPLCPATILWNPEGAEPKLSQGQEGGQRQLFLRIHPAAFLQLFDELVRLTKMENPRLYVEDLRFQIGSIEITGPASTETLLSVLHPYSTSEIPLQKHASLFQSLNGLTNPAVLTSDAILHFSVVDPRLRYPPRRVEFSDDDEAQIKLLEMIARWPAEDGLGPSAIFDRDARHKASSLPSQKSIDRRKRAAAAGSYLAPTVADPPIPITLMAQRSGSSSQNQGKWIMLAPWGCILPLWHSIVHCPLVSGLNPRFGGLQEVMQVAFERGLAWFPADYLGTDAGADWELEQRRRRRRLWERRPKSKRIEWSTVDLGAGRKGELGDGFACDFELLFGLAKADDAAVEDQDSSDETESKEDAGSETAENSGTNVDDESSRPPSLKLLNLVPKTTLDALLSSREPASSVPPWAIFQVRIRLVGRGVVRPCARVYRLPEDREPAAGEGSSLPGDLGQQWLDEGGVSSAGRGSLSATRRTRAGGGRATTGVSGPQQLARELLAPPTAYPVPAANQERMQGHPLVPGPEHLIGFVTTGSFCLVEGGGAAVGSLALEKVLPDLRRARTQAQLCVVRNAGEGVGWLARWEAL